MSGPQIAPKQSAVISATLEDFNEITDIIPVSQILITLKTETSLTHTSKFPHQDSNSLARFLHQLDSSFAMAYLDGTFEDKSLLEGLLKGLEHLIFDWTLSIITFHPALITAQVQDQLICMWGGHVLNKQTPKFRHVAHVQLTQCKQTAVIF